MSSFLGTNFESEWSKVWTGDYNLTPNTKVGSVLGTNRTGKGILEHI